MRLGDCSRCCVDAAIWDHEDDDDADELLLLLWLEAMPMPSPVLFSVGEN